MAHPSSQGEPCCYPDGHAGQHRHRRDAEADRRWNRSQGGRDAAARYRNRHPVERALTVMKSSAKRRVGHDG